MSDVFDVVRGANPIKDVDRYAEVVAGLGAQLHRISGRDEMIDSKPSVVSLESVPVGPPQRRWWIGAAAVVIAIALGGLGYALVSNNGGSDVADVPAATTLPTEATVTTAEATATPLETAELFLARWAAADATGAETLISSTATASCYECLDTAVKPWVAHKYRGVDIRTMAMAYVGGAGVEYACSAVDDLVTCSMGYKTLLAASEYSDGFEWVSIYTVVDGLITHLELGWYPEMTSRESIADYEQWLADNHPDEVTELFFMGTLLVNDADQRAAHRRYIAEWAETR